MNTIYEGIYGYNLNFTDSKDIIIGDTVKIKEPGLVIKKYKIGDEYYSSIGGDADSSEVIDEESFKKNAASKVSIIPNTTVSFNGNGAKGSMADVNIFGKYVLPENEFEVPANKQFVGWSLSASGDSIITEIDVSKNITLYAKWNEVKPDENLILYTYKFKSGETQTFIINSIDK